MSSGSRPSCGIEIAASARVSDGSGALPEAAASASACKRTCCQGSRWGLRVVPRTGARHLADKAGNDHV